MTETSMTQPMGFRGLAAQAFRLLSRRYPIIIAAGLLITLIIGILMAALITLFVAGDINPFVLGLAGFTVYLLSTFYIYAFMTRVITLDLRGARVSLKQVLGSIHSGTVLKLCGASLLVAFGVVAGLILLIIPGLVLSVYLLFTLPVVVEENLNIWPAIRRSMQLVKGHWWYTFGCFIVSVLVVQILNQLVSRLLGLIFLPMGLEWAEATVVGSLLSFPLLLPLQFVIPPLLYYELRIRHGEMMLKSGQLVEA